MKVSYCEIIVVAAGVKSSEDNREQHYCGKHKTELFKGNNAQDKRPCQIELFFYRNRPKHRQQQRIRLFRPGVHNIEIGCEEYVVPWICIFHDWLATHLFKYAEANKSYSHAQVIQRPYPQYPSHIKIRNMNASVEFLFFYQ